MKLVSIIIPFYHETVDQLRTVLGSINNQVGIEMDQVEVILVSDGGPTVAIEQEFPHIRYTLRLIHHDENRGAGVARQAGMDVAQGQYYMFVDADDQLQNVNALETFFRTVRLQGDRDVFISKYLEQMVDEDHGGYRYSVHRNDNWTAPVAKWFNRDYINEIGLRWRDDLRVFEDTYFVGLACELATQIYHIEEVTYVWLFNEHSTVRQHDQSFLNQLDMWAHMNHAYLDMIAMQWPAQLLDSFSDYVADIYLRQQRYEARDQAAFEEEHRSLMLAYANLWPIVKPRLRQLINEITDTSPEFKDYTTLQLRDFVKEQDVLYQD